MLSGKHVSMSAYVHKFLKLIIFGYHIFLQDVDIERYSPIPKQHSNYTSDNSSTKSRSKSYKNFPKALTNASTPTPESKPNPVYIPKPPLREPDNNRPFTSMIDKLIDEERNRPSNHSLQDRDIQLGPLVNPKFVNFQLNGQNMHGSSTDFRPLQSECATPSLQELSAGQGKVDPGPLSTPVSALQGAAVEETEDTEGSQLSQHPSSSVVSAPIPTGLDDKEFLQQYRELTPEQRKQQLFVQKQALLQEQDRLKKILGEQERLLELKQIQLRKQQDIQKERLNYFDKTGTFPPNFDYSELRASKNSSGFEQGMVYPATNGFAPMYPKPPFLPIQPQVNQMMPPQPLPYNGAMPAMPIVTGPMYNPGYMAGPMTMNGPVGKSEYTANKENQNHGKFNFI